MHIVELWCSRGKSNPSFIGFDEYVIKVLRLGCIKLVYVGSNPTYSKIPSTHFLRTDLDNAKTNFRVYGAATSRQEGLRRDGLQDTHSSKIFLGTVSIV